MKDKDNGLSGKWVPARVACDRQRIWPWGF